MAPFDGSHTSSYSPSIATMALSCTYWSKIARFLNPTCIWRLRRVWPRRNFVKMFDADKTRMIGYRTVKKLWRYVKPFSSNTGTSGTDKQTDRQIWYINIARQCADARYKKTRMVWLPDGKKIEDMITRFDTIHEHDGQATHDGIGRAYA